ncbi:MAG: SAM-dependent methyltransferase [Leptolyngbyaceae cyanobacterium MO_188.B28]|nr:SAM-dependent methyltransferase [Leptolyngbyaceae cyanobacterium MO_188.B28]
MLKFFQFIIFLILQILFLPFAICGGLLALYFEMVVSRKLGVSFTAEQAIQPRWTMHYFAVRSDPNTVAFMKHLPIESHLGFLGMFGAALLANRICGYIPSFTQIPEYGKETLSSFICSRTVLFDQIMERYASEVEQIVIMGGGFDLRVLQLTRDGSANVFEVDQEKTQSMKLETIQKAGLSNDWITYITVDFREESWVEKLLEHGFDQTKRTYFHWESVSLYLEEDVVRDTIAKMSSLSSKGSILAQDFYAKSFIKGETYLMRKAVQLVEKMGEPWLYGIDMSDDVKTSIEALVNEFNFQALEVSQFGHKGKTGKPFYAISVCEKV